ncbi:MAG: acyltransferase [Flavobacteriales bacterium]|nr:acyltransferase [Flavobacteriales bacterium]
MKDDSLARVDRYSPALDGVRAMAVIAIIIYHFRESLMPGGYLGVDMFFVISGFVISNSLISRQDNSASGFLGGFYKRRAKRLIPALLFAFTVAAVAVSFFVKEPTTYILTGLSSLVGLANFNLYYNSIGYWSEFAVLNPFTHTWTLGVEEQFYLIYPIIFWILMKGSWKVRKIISVLAIACLLSFLGFVEKSGSNQMLAYYMIPFRLWEVTFGCLVSIGLVTTNNNLLKFVLGKLSAIAILLVMVVFIFIPHGNLVIDTLFIVISTAILIIRIVQAESIQSPSPSLFPISNGFIVYIGKISYSLYLWHWIVIVLGRWTVGVTDSTLLPLLLLIVGFAVVSYHFIEWPLRHCSWRMSLRPRLVLLPMIGAVVGSIVLLTFFPNQNHLYLGSKHSLSSILDKYPFQPSKNPPKCTKIRIVGNSHSLHIVPMLTVIADKCGVELVFEQRPNYILIPNGGDSDMDRLDEVLNSLDKGDILILSSKYTYLYQVPYLNARGDKWKDHTEEKNSKGFGLDIWLQELDEILIEADERGINVVLFLPNVEFNTKVMNADFCTAEWFRKPDKKCNVTVSREFLDSRFPSAYFEEVESRVRFNSNFFAFNPLPIFCPEEGDCSNILDGKVLFMDTNHLNPEGSYLMLEAFLDFLVDNDLI